MRESRLSGSVRGATRNGRLYRDWETLKNSAVSRAFPRSRFQIASVWSNNSNPAKKPHLRCLPVVVIE